MTVNGVEMVFSKQSMIDRITSVGLVKEISDDILSIMDNLDGQPVGSNSWNRQVNNEPVYTCEGKDGKYYDVNEADCMTKEKYNSLYCGKEQNEPDICD